jgi:hypothetical protein
MASVDSIIDIKRAASPAALASSDPVLKFYARHETDRRRMASSLLSSSRLSTISILRSMAGIIANSSMKVNRQTQTPFADNLSNKPHV